MRKEVVIDSKTYYVAKPTAQDEAQAKFQQSKTFSQAIQNGACLRLHLDKVLKDRGIWNDNDTKEVEELSNKVTKNLEILEEGGIDIMEARRIAIETGKLRMQVVEKLSITRDHISLTAEGQADDAYFDCLVANCCFNEDGTKVFKSYEDYISKSNEDYAPVLAKELSNLIYGGNDFIKSLDENKFLIEFGFVNKDLQFINENGEIVDQNYEPIVKEEKKERKPFLKNGEPINS